MTTDIGKERGSSLLGRDKGITTKVLSHSTSNKGDI